MGSEPARIWKMQNANPGYRNSQHSRPHNRLRLLMFAGPFVLFFAIICFSGCSDDETIRKLASLDTRLERVEAKLTQVEARTEKMVLLERKVKKLQESISELNNSTTPKSVKGRYHEVRHGENLSVIAQEYGMTVQELSRLNGIPPQAIIRPGQMLLVKPES
ncbi:MAG: LysM domain-containing protein [Deltaproteobacteria bacterium]|jgi:LysM repeat protein